MRSLTVKLTLAFLLVGAIGAILVAVLVGQRTRSEFDRFVSARDQPALVQALGNYYESKGSWEGVTAMLEADSSLSPYSHGGVILVDANDTIVLGKPPSNNTDTLPPTLLENSTAITVDGQVVGSLVFIGPPDGNGRPPNDNAFMQGVTWASAVSAAIAALIALVLGGLLARTLTRPIRELTSATQAMASGALDQQVKVRSDDEIGELAASFNQMSSDLAHASHMRKQMTADLAHDLRTPLTILRGYTEGLQDGRVKGTPALYTIMHGEVEHLQRLVEDLRVLSLADAGELSLNRRMVDPAALLERTGLAYIVQAENQGIELRVDTQAALPSINVDTDRMSQVLNNLVSNALRYTTRGAITLSAHADAEYVHLQVRDTGTGIGPDELPFIFDRFYRADKSRQRDESSESGLGLAISKAIVETHGGTIKVESAIGVGTTFTITLPIAISQSDQERTLGQTPTLRTADQRH